MAIQPQYNLQLTSFSSFQIDTNAATIDAAGESVAVIGRLQLPARTGSKTISAAGSGKIFWRTSTPITFANAGTTISVGVQDVLGTGLEDGTYDVKKDLVGGTDTITASAFQLTTMGSGTKTIAHNDLIAVVFTVVSRAGADSVLVRRTSGGGFSHATSNDAMFPYGTADAGTLAVSTSMPFVAIVFDDGTVGWIQSLALPDFITSAATISYNSGSTPDEYIATFTPTVPIQIAGIGVFLTLVATADTFEIILYSDPYGSPTIIETVVPDNDQLGGGGGKIVYAITPVTLAVGTTYGVAARPTSANSLSWNYVDLGSGMDALKAITPLPSIKMAARTNQTGAFVETQTYHLPYVILDVCGLDDGAGGGGGMLRHPGMNGGGNA